MEGHITRYNIARIFQNIASMQEQHANSRADCRVPHDKPSKLLSSASDSLERTLGSVRLLHPMRPLRNNPQHTWWPPRACLSPRIHVGYFYPKDVASRDESKAVSIIVIGTPGISVNRSRGALCLELYGAIESDRYSRLEVKVEIAFPVEGIATSRKGQDTIRNQHPSEGVKTLWNLKHLAIGGL